MMLATYFHRPGDTRRVNWSILRRQAVRRTLYTAQFMLGRFGIIYQFVSKSEKRNQQPQLGQGPCQCYKAYWTYGASTHTL